MLLRLKYLRIDTSCDTMPGARAIGGILRTFSSKSSVNSSIGAKSQILILNTLCDASWSNSRCPSNLWRVIGPSESPRYDLLQRADHWRVCRQKLFYRVEALLEHRCHPKSKSFLKMSRHDRSASTGMSSRQSSVAIEAYDAHEQRKAAQEGHGLFGRVGSMLGL